MAPRERWTVGSLAAAASIVPAVGTACAVLSIFRIGLSGVDVGLFLGFYVVTGLGVTVGLHRLFAHRSFAAAPWVRAALAVSGALALQGPTRGWAADHRRHHAFSDASGDPHSPVRGRRVTARGLLHAHVGWFFDPDRTVLSRYVPDLEKDAVVVAIDRLYPLWVVATFALPALLGFALTGTPRGALGGLLWGGCARVFAVQHSTWSVNSICHWWGARPYATRDGSRNNLVVAGLTLGEGWHNNHHAFPWSARSGFRWWQLDPSWWLIRALAAAGLVWDVRLPDPARLDDRRTRS